MTVSPVWRGTAWPLEQADDACELDWSTLAHSGHNGMWLIVLGLSWWFVAEPTSAPLLELAEDVAWALEMMTP